MAYAVTDFSRFTAAYTTDEGVNSAIILRTVYSNIAALGLGTAPAAGTQLFRGKPRHVYISNTNAGKVIRRKVPYNSGTLSAAETALGTATIDGLAGWTVHGHTGERTRH